jgi:hypothetical protein
MANALYDHGREGFLDGSIDWDTDDIKVILVDKDAGAGYTLDLANDTYLADVTAATIIATSGNLASKTVAAGVADAADLTFSAVGAGYTIDYLIIYQDTGNAATSRLIGCIDTATGLPYTTSGANVTVAWDNGANRIFKL